MIAEMVVAGRGIGYGDGDEERWDEDARNLGFR